MPIRRRSTAATVGWGATPALLTLFLSQVARPLAALASFTVPLRRQEVPVKANGKTVAYKSAYFGTIYVGTPKPQEFSVVFDTGSGHVLLPSSTCQEELSCLRHRRYDRELSATANTNAFGGAAAASAGDDRHEQRFRRLRWRASSAPLRVDLASIAYGTGEATGDIVSDVVCIGSPLADPEVGEEATALQNRLPRHCARARIVAAREMTPEPFGSFDFDGVFGLSSLSLDPEFHVLGGLINSSGLEPVFGVYLGSLDASSAFEGEVSFGGPAERRCAGGCSAAMRWAPVVDPQWGYWRIAVHALRIGGRPFSLCASPDDGCYAIVDTGTSMLGVPREAYAAMLGLTARAAEGGDEVDCRAVAGPPIVFDLGGGLSIELGAEDYSRPAVSHVARRGGSVTKPVCRASLLPVDLQPAMGKVFLLGESVLRKYYTAFDVGRERVGFAPAAASASAAAPQLAAARAAGALASAPGASLVV